MIERDRAMATLITEMLRSAWAGPMALTQAEQIDNANQQLLTGAVTAVLLGGGSEPLTVLEHVRLVAPSVPVVLLAADYLGEEALAALRVGAQDVLCHPELTPARLVRALIHAIERKRAEVQLAHRALQDPLTGLPNRTLFLDRLRVALDRARRTGLVTGVLFLDVDHFKTINDSFGHAAGDRVLTALASRLRAVLRPMDTVARFGGDEFTFLFEDLGDAREALAIAERVREAATVPVGIDEEPRPLSVSIGVATAADPGISPEALVREADAAMYQAKRRGGGEASLAGTDDGLAGGPQAADHAAPPELANELRAALERAELRVLYQPLYGLRDGQQVSGFEALVRWQHPERGLIAPREFIPLAEEIGLCAAIGHFVLREALPLLARLRAARKDLTVAINLSYDQLADAELALALAAVGQAGLQPAAVCVDIPEAAVSRDPDQAIRAARVLRSAGVRVAIDDYGAGSVPLHNLRRLQPDQLKIHESIVGELDGHPPDGAIVGAVVELAHALGMQVIAEGVETDVQLTELRLLGCDGAQGYLLGRPVAAEQLEELIAGAM